MTSAETARTSPDGFRAFLPLSQPTASPVQNVAFLARQVQDLTAIIGVLALVSAIANIKLSLDVETALQSLSRDEAPSSWEGASQFVDLLGLALSIGFTLNAIMTMIMLKRMLDNGAFWTPHLATRASHWAVTGWIIPIIGWFRPYQLVCQIWETCPSDGWGDGPYGNQHVRLPIVIKLWWVAFVLLDFLRYGIGFVWRETVGLDELGARILASAAYDGLRVVAAVLFILSVRCLATRHAQGRAKYEHAQARAAEPFTDDPIML